MGGGDNSATDTAFLIDTPAHCISFSPYLHGGLVLVLGANAPDGIIQGQLVLDVSGMLDLGAPQGADAG